MATSAHVGKTPPRNEAAIPLWLRRWAWRMRAFARRRNRATLLFEAPVRGSGQSPDCSHENFALGWPRNDEARPTHTSVAAENAKWNSYSTTKLVVVKSCGLTTRKASGKQRRERALGEPQGALLHNQTAHEAAAGCAAVLQPGQRGGPLRGPA